MLIRLGDYLRGVRDLRINGPVNIEGYQNKNWNKKYSTAIFKFHDHIYPFSVNTIIYLHHQIELRNRFTATPAFHMIVQCLESKVTENSG